MGLLSLSDIRDEMSASLGARGDIASTRLNQWINLAYYDLASAVDFPDLTAETSFNTAIGDYNYSGPTDALAWLYVEDRPSSRLLTWIPLMEWYRYNNDDQGTPIYWTRFRWEVYLYPTPDAASNMGLIYKQTPTALSNDIDVTILPPYTDQAILLLAMHHGLLAVGDDARAALWLNRAINYLSSRITAEDYSKLLAGLEKTRAMLETSLGQ